MKEERKGGNQRRFHLCFCKGQKESREAGEVGKMEGGKEGGKKGKREGRKQEHAKADVDPGPLSPAW